VRGFVAVTDASMRLRSLKKHVTINTSFFLKESLVGVIFSHFSAIAVNSNGTFHNFANSDNI